MRRLRQSSSDIAAYRMPAEWEPHEATWLVWPKNKTTWPGTMLAEVESIYIRMIMALLAGEKVHLLVDDEKTTRKVLSRLPRPAQTQRLFFHRVKTVDTWIRDYGPIFIKVEGGRSKVEGEVAFTKWIFDAWGGKYSDLARDNGVVNRIDFLKSYRRFDPGIVMEGGSIEVNGKGTLLTTEQCLLNPYRNKKLSRAGIEGYLKKYLGVRNIVWLKEGIEGDDTDGHVDDVTRFMDPTTLVTATEPDLRDNNHAILKENLEILRRSSDQNGKKFKIVELPMPGRVGEGRRDTGHTRLPASYANFYIGNAVVLAPLYSHKNDRPALKILKRVFPGRKVVGIECTALVYGLGSIHCVTQQQPK